MNAQGSSGLVDELGSAGRMVNAEGGVPDGPASADIEVVVIEMGRKGSCQSERQHRGRPRSRDPADSADTVQLEDNWYARAVL